MNTDSILAQVEAQVPDLCSGSDSRNHLAEDCCHGFVLVRGRQTRFRGWRAENDEEQRAILVPNSYAEIANLLIPEDIP